MRRPRVAVAGATGFVGRALLPALAADFEVVALARNPRAPGGAIEWRRCDLFSIAETEAALAGAEVAVYLIHSMLPTARLTQASFEDLDLVLADNFGRAAARQGVGRIVYLGGLVPPGDGSLSPHLRSRLEVERALGAHGVPVTALRAGLVVGAGGSSLRILMRLVRRLPIMVCPRWTRSLTQPIALDDAVALLRAAVADPETAGRVCEIGGPDVLSYRDMMRETARVLGLRRLMLPVPFVSPAISRLWVALVTQTPLALVRPLIESLRHPMLVSDPWLQRRLAMPGEHFATALARAAALPDAVSPQAGPASARGDGTVRSVQRLPLPAGAASAIDAGDVAREYAAWLPRALPWLLRADFDGERCRFRARGLGLLLLELTLRPARSTPDRALFEVTGGVLARVGAAPPGRLEFRITPDGGQLLAAVHDFRPRLPWPLYRVTQAQVHLRVMRAFGRHLARAHRF